MIASTKRFLNLPKRIGIIPHQTSGTSTTAPGTSMANAKMIIATTGISLIVSIMQRDIVLKEKLVCFFIGQAQPLRLQKQSPKPERDKILQDRLKPKLQPQPLRKPH